MGVKAQSAAAIYIPAQMLKPYIGNQIKAIRIGLMSNATEASVFIKKDLDGENVAEKLIGDAARGWNETEMDYTIEEGDLYIGYESTGVNQVALSDSYSENGLFLRESDGSWANYASLNEWNALCLEIVINGKKMPDHAMSVVSLDKCYPQKDKIFTISGIVENQTLVPVTEYEINYQINDEIKGSKTFHDLSLTSNQKDTFKIEVPAISEIGKYKLIVNLSKVNGQENENINSSKMESTVNCKEYYFPRKVVVEEGSGTWCQYCVRGIVGMHEMRKRYPDTFIGIVSHYNDVMAASSYNSLHSKFFSAGLPNSVMNRKSELVMDPSFINLEEAYLKELIPSDIGIQVEASFASEAKDAINITTTTTFGFSKENVAYRIALVLIEDSVRGTGKGYEQLNAYTKESGGRFDGIEMGGFENLPFTVPAEKMVYENVARGIYKSYMGNLNSVPYTVEKGESYNFSYEISKADLKNAKVLNKDYLEVVALLLNTNTGEIVNADKIKVMPYDPMGIKNTGISQLEVYAENGSIYVDGIYDIFHVFTLDGVEINSSHLESGIYLVQVIIGKNITVRKVIVK